MLMLCFSFTWPRKTHPFFLNYLPTKIQQLHFHVQSQRQDCSSLFDDHEPFDEMPELDVVKATALIGHLAKGERHKQAINVFKRMHLLNIRPNEFTFGTVFPSSMLLGNLDLGRQLHACALKMGLHSIVFVGSAVLDLYAKLSCIKEARRAFDDIEEPNVVSYTTLIHGYLKKESPEEALWLFRRMPERNVVTWNAMIGGYSQMGHNEQAVNLFVEMLREGVVPSEFTFPCVIIAAANIAALGMGKTFHGCALKSLANVDEFIGNSLISFYAKCGSMEDSLLVFDKLRKRTIVSWNALICGFAQNGRGEEAVRIFEKMGTIGPRPNHVTFLGLLWACNHAGLVDKGYLYFNQAKIENPGLLKAEHYACMLDLLSRHGHFEEAQGFLGDLPFDPGIGFWKALLGGCQIHSNAELGELAARKILALDPKDVASYVMLSNAYSAAGRWEDASMVRREINEKGMKTVPGSSWIEIRSKVHVFMTRDKTHTRKAETYKILGMFIEHMGEIKSFDFLLY